jgi:hypothetical protein
VFTPEMRLTTGNRRRLPFPLMGLFSKSVPPITVDDHIARDDRALRAAFEAARGGDWAPARDLMATTRDDYDLRGHYSGVLAQSATLNVWSRMRPGPIQIPVDTSASWADRWAADDPDNPDAHLVRASSLTMRAWEVRGSGWASTVGQSAAGEFIRLLQLAVPVNERAAALFPADPTPWVQRLLLMVALNTDRPTFDRGWGEVHLRDRLNRAGHEFRLMYLCHKWHGSHEEMFAFARQAAAAAPDGSPLHVLPVQAANEWALWELDREDDSLRGLKRVADVWRKDPAYQADLDNALTRWFRRAPRRHGMWFQDLNTLAYGLARARRHHDNKPVFEAIGPYRTDLPWSWWAAEVGREKAFQWARKDALRT